MAGKQMRSKGSSKSSHHGCCYSNDLQSTSASHNGRFRCSGADWLSYSLRRKAGLWLWDKGPSIVSQGEPFRYRQKALNEEKTFSLIFSTNYLLNAIIWVIWAHYNENNYRKMQQTVQEGYKTENPQCQCTTGTYACFECFPAFGIQSRMSLTMKSLCNSYNTLLLPKRTSCSGNLNHHCNPFHEQCGGLIVLIFHSRRLRVQS